jgi:protein-disulfide isomerase
MNDRVEKWVSIALAVSAIVVAASAAVLVLRRGSSAEARPPAGAERAAPHIDAWSEARASGIVLHGDSTARVTLVEFGDLECPACRGFQETVSELIRAHPADLEVLFVPLPLRMHRFALPAARAMECADSMGRAREWAESVYANQDSLGLLSWGTLAKRAGIGDTLAILVCARTAKSYRRIDQGMTLANKYGITATPTIWVNGWQFRGGVPTATLDSMIVKMARGTQ